MKQYLFLLTCIFLIFGSFICCKQRTERIQKSYIDGVEVISNPMESSASKTDFSTINLETEAIIDTENNETAEIGLTDIQSFDVDARGNIYVFNPKSSLDLIFKFDKNTDYLSSFLQKGQGPGEVQYLAQLIINNDELIVTDITKYLFLDLNGALKKEISKDTNILAVIPLDNGNYLARERQRDVSDSSVQHLVINLYDGSFSLIKEIARVTRPNPLKGKGWNALPTYIQISVSNNRIFEATSAAGYEIRVYDQNGVLLRRIRKKYSPVPISEEDKNRIMQLYSGLPEQYKNNIFFSEHFPPFQTLLFTDEKSRLFVMTYEKGSTQNEHWFDIFDPGGFFSGRMLLRNYGHTGNQIAALPAIKKNGLIYCLEENENGFKQIVVYRTTWE